MGGLPTEMWRKSFTGWGVLVQLSHGGAQGKRGMMLRWSILQLFNNAIMQVMPVIVFKAMTTITIKYKS